MTSSEPTLIFSIEESVSSIDERAWDRLVPHTAPAFMRHAFLVSLEKSDCVGLESGWIPQVLAVRRQPDDVLIGAAPAYIKLHSMGEFVYDWAWADASHRSGLQYYPKLVVAVPFSPVAGPRLLVDDALEPETKVAVRRAMLRALEQAARHHECSGLHVLFCTPEERDLATSMGFTERLGLQFHWRNESYTDFDDFLRRFRSKRRNQIKRERRRVEQAGVEIIALSGAEIETEHMDAAFRFYADTVDRFSWGRRYLNRSFFDALHTTCPEVIQLTLARMRDDGAIVGGTFNLQNGGRRFGRYWGTSEHIPNLHFEVCAYSPIEQCIRTGIQVFEAGAGGGSHKYGRGFMPSETLSVHKLFNRDFHGMIASFCERERLHLRKEARSLEEQLFCR